MHNGKWLSLNYEIYLYYITELGEWLLLFKHGTVQLCAHFRCSSCVIMQFWNTVITCQIYSCWLFLIAHKVRPADIKVVAALGDSLTVSSRAWLVFCHNWINPLNNSQNFPLTVFHPNPSFASHSFSQLFGSYAVICLWFMRLVFSSLFVLSSCKSNLYQSF